MKGFKIHCLNKIAEMGLKLLTENYEITDNLNEAEAVLVRSANMHELELPPGLLAIARAGAGVNNIPLDKCAEKGIVVFNTPGANANGVKELVIASLFLASRDIIGGINWVNSIKDEPDLVNLVEKNKSRFAGNEIKGKKLGVIGLGAIGVLVANAAIKLGMDVYGYDPFISVGSAWRLSKYIKPARSKEELFKICDYITVHVPLTEETRGMFNKDAFALMKDGVIILNFSRAEVVNEEDMLQALSASKVRRYVTDFPTPKIVGAPGVIAIPHLGASTSESEENCAIMAVKQLMDYLEHGIIRNSVNYPNCDMGACEHAGRLAINHRNIPNMLGQFTSALAQENINIAKMLNKSRGPWAYTLIDIDSPTTEEMAKKLEAIDGVLKVRIIK